jgi:septal ring factor EnvC (AmiA/AmiB activator)
MYRKSVIKTDKFKNSLTSITLEPKQTFQQRRSVREDETQNLIKRQEQKLEEIQNEQDLLKAQLKDLDEPISKKTSTNTK